MKEKLVLKDYYGEDWSKHFSKDSTLKTLLKKLKLQCYAIENINTEEMDYRHTIVNFNMREEEGSEQIPVNLLVVAGKPTWQEMIEISFDTGTISDRKIIVYDDSDDPHGKDDWVYRRSWASWFVDGINWRHSNMWVVKTHGIKHDERKQGLFYELEFSPVTRSPGRLLRHDEELTREVFEKAEFWAVYYEYIKWNHPSLPYGIHDISDEIYRVLGEDYNITPKVSWGDRGFHVLVRTKYNTLSISM